MARRYDYQGARQAIADNAAQTIVFNPSEIPGDNIVAYHVALEGGTTLADVTRIRLKAGGTSILDITPAELRAMIERLSRSNYQLAAAATIFTIPLYILDEPDMDLADQSQFPRNAGATLELTLTNGVGDAGNALVAFTETSVEPLLFPKYLSTAMGVPLGANAFRYPLAQDGMVSGFSISAVGIGLIRMVLGGVQFLNLPGPTFAVTDAAPEAGYDIFTEVQKMEYGPIALTDPTFFRLPVGAPAPSGTSYIELTTPDVATAANDWGGAAATPLAEPIALWSLIQQG